MVFGFVYLCFVLFLGRTLLVEKERGERRVGVGIVEGPSNPRRKPSDLKCLLLVP